MPPLSSRTLTGVALGVATICIGGLSSGPNFSAAHAQQDAAAADLLAQQNRLVTLASTLHKQGKIDEAVTAARDAIAIMRQRRGDAEPGILEGLEWIADMLLGAGRTEAAIEPLAEAVAWREAHQPDNYMTADRRNVLSILRQSLTHTAEQRAQLEQAKAFNADVMKLTAAGRDAEALPLAIRVLEIRKAILGERHSHCAQALSNLATICGELGQFDRGEALLLEALGVYRTLLGAAHPECGTTLNNLGALYYKAGRFDDAEPAYRDAAAIARAAYGSELNADYAQAINNLSVLYVHRGDFVRAEPLARRAVEIRKEVLPANHPDYAISINNLASLYSDMGDYERAEPLFHQNLAIVAKSQGEGHPAYATGLNNLAALYHSRGELLRAAPLYRQASEVLKTALGDRHPHYAISLNNRAVIHRALGEYDQAVTLFQQALDIDREVLTERHPEYAKTMGNLGLVYQDMNRLDEARALFETALGISAESVGKEHREYAAMLARLAGLLRQQGDIAAAEPLYREALDIMTQHIDAAATVQDQQGQLAARRQADHYLDNYLSCLLARPDADEAAYAAVLAWKGATHVRQRAARLAAEDPGLAPHLAKLQTAVSKWSALVRSPSPADPQWSKLVEQLAQQRLQIEAELGAKSAAYRAAAKAPTTAELAAALPEGAVLIDYFQLWRQPSPGDDPAKNPGHARLLAFVVARGRSVRMLDLGPLEPVSAAVETWRRDFGASAAARTAGVELREKIWQPLAASVAGAQVVLISPDGSLGSLPFAALPGAAPDRYLIEDVAIALVPVPQLIPALLASTTVKELPHDLLVLGGVNYDQRDLSAERPAADPARADQSTPLRPWELRSAIAARSLRGRSGANPWLQLRGTDSEVRFIRELYRDTLKLPADTDRIASLFDVGATEEAVRRLAPQAYLIHLATHGFFDSPAPAAAAPATLGDQPAAPTNPGQLAGLVLAGANHPPEIPADPAAIAQLPDDGYLTADEIAAMPLSGAQLVVLSACESGLGQAAAGEGLLGIQRAFQLAGARATIATLWKVNDEVTRRVMEEFYRGYLVDKLSPLAALHRAQLWALNNADLFPRGVEPPTGSAAPARLPPRYWAAFTLSGDWR